ncbi:MAG: restriction endonuclease subunit S [Burkholderiales bacterium]
MREAPASYLVEQQQPRHSAKLVSAKAGSGNPARQLWQTHHLREVVRTASGGTPKRDRSQFFGGPIPWVKSGELRDGVVHEAEESITQLGLDSSSAKIFPKGTLCIALYGATVGRLGILNIEAATNQAVCGIFPSSKLDTKYLFHFLFSRREALIREAKGGAQPNISQEIIRELRVPVPLLEEQRRIVAELETQLTRLEAGVIALKRVQANLKRYRASVLKAACEGRLVPTEAELARRDGRAFESGNDLLIRLERQSPGIQSTKRKPPKTVDESVLPGLPAGWRWARMDIVCHKVQDGTHFSPKEQADTGAFRYITAKNIKVWGLDLTNVTYLTEEVHREIFARCNPEK